MGSSSDVVPLDEVNDLAAACKRIEELERTATKLREEVGVDSSCIFYSSSVMSWSVIYRAGTSFCASEAMCIIFSVYYLCAALFCLCV